MRKVLQDWYQRYLSDPEAVILLLLLLFALLLLSIVGKMLAPVFAGLVIAYLLEGLVYRLEKIKCPHWLAVSLVYLFFIGFFVIALFILLPIIMRQLTNLVSEMPNMITKGQEMMVLLPQRYPDYFSVDQMHGLVEQIKLGVGKFGQTVLSFSLATIPSVIGIVIYVVMVPLLVFFFLLDRDKITQWFVSYLPKKRVLITRIWKEVNEQLGNYIRGKVVEIIIVAIISYIAFAIMKLPFALLLAVLVGLSVLIPFIGVAVVTIPVVVIAYLQWGLSSDFAYLLIVYSIICILDANVLVPILFSEAVNLHPVAIIVAILFFGGLWGFWGVFFAIPLANVVQAIFNAWPRQISNLETKHHSSKVS